MRWAKIVGATLLLSGVPLYIFLFQSLSSHPPNYDAYAKQTLRHLLTVCSVYWSEHGEDKDCNLDVAVKQDTGFQSTAGVVLKGGGSERGFIAFSKHELSNRTFRIDSGGEISTLQKNINLNEEISAGALSDSSYYVDHE